MKKRLITAIVGIATVAVLLVGPLAGCSSKSKSGTEVGNGPRAKEMLGQPGANAANEQKAKDKQQQGGE